MTTNPTTAADSTQNSPLPIKANGTDQLGRDAFLNLLVTQLQHQDPTQPQADGEFLAQLATFSQLEQLQRMNTTMEKIALFFEETAEPTPAPTASSATASSKA